MYLFPSDLLIINNFLFHPRAIADEKKPHLSDEMNDCTDLDTRYVRALVRFGDLLEKDDDLFSKVRLKSVYLLKDLHPFSN